MTTPAPSSSSPACASTAPAVSPPAEAVRPALRPNPWPARLAPLARLATTGLVVAAAAWAGVQLWDHYERAPWTRDGRVRANVVQIAPDVSGLVTAVAVQDNQSVGAGALLFEVDRARYALALRQAQAVLAAQRTALAQAQRETARNTGLGTLVSQEVQEQARSRAEQAQSAVAQAQVALDGARLNLERAEVRAPTGGQVTNLDLRQGSYATAGHPALALVDAQSFYVEGYFEETKLPRIHLGDRVLVTPMGGTALRGTVDSFAAGIADRDRSTGANLLPNVNPSFNWVRLAQRIPVRVRLDPLPAGARLVAGQTVTVQVQQGSAPVAAAAPTTAPHTAQKG
ncbi:MAG: efflux RND transporter periplasmic adaptor subunit [Pseudomonadota bacterium]